MLIDPHMFSRVHRSLTPILGKIPTGIHRHWVKNLVYELPYDLAVPLLGIYSKELTGGTQRDLCTPMCIAAVFTVATQVSIDG